MRAAERAAEALIRNPYKSDRAIALEIGVGVMTVRRARTRMINSNSAPAEYDNKRLCSNGMTRRMPKKNCGLIRSWPRCLPLSRGFPFGQ